MSRNTTEFQILKKEILEQPPGETHRLGRTILPVSTQRKSALSGLLSPPAAERLACSDELTVQIPLWSNQPGASPCARSFFPTRSAQATGQPVRFCARLRIRQASKVGSLRAGGLISEAAREFIRPAGRVWTYRSISAKHS